MTSSPPDEHGHDHHEGVDHGSSVRCPPCAASSTPPPSFRLAPARRRAPYNVCLVDLEDGERVMGRGRGLDSTPQDVTIGLRVQSRAGEDGVVFYEPA